MFVCVCGECDVINCYKEEVMYKERFFIGVQVGVLVYLWWDVLRLE